MLEKIFFRKTVKKAETVMETINKESKDISKSTKKLVNEGMVSLELITILIGTGIIVGVLADVVSIAVNIKLLRKD